MYIENARKLVKSYDPLEGYTLTVWQHNEREAKKRKWSPFAWQIAKNGPQVASSRMLVTKDFVGAHDLDAEKLGQKAPRYQSLKDAAKAGLAALFKIVSKEDIGEARKL